jgi:hypothetical protein
LLVELSREAEGNETQDSEAKRTEIYWSNYPRSEAKRDLTFAEKNEVKFEALVELSRRRRRAIHLPVVSETQISKTK